MQFNESFDWPIHKRRTEGATEEEDKCFLFVMYEDHSIDSI